MQNTTPSSGTLAISPTDLDLNHTLTPGQSFRWARDEEGRWTGVVGRRVVRIYREDERIHYEVWPDGDAEALVRDYFRLDVPLEELYCDWGKDDGPLSQAVDHFRGLRVLRQEPEETLLSYVCSAANSVSRISRAVEAMSRRWGEHIATVEGQDYHSFPTAQALARADITDLENLCGLGFRGANLSFVARQLAERSTEWLCSLRQASYQDARRELLSIRGVGLKIADCVLLFSLDKDEAFPVDTHIRQVAVKHYLPEFRQKTLTPAVYEQIAAHFRNRFGRYAGWAQEYLFYHHLLRHRPSERTLRC